MLFKETASQTAGPYLHIGMDPHAAGNAGTPGAQNVLAGPEAVGGRILIEGIVYDGAGEPVRDCAVEIWQANAAGKYHHPADPRDLPDDPAFSCWGRASADFASGLYRFETVMPGSAPDRTGRPQAPHVNIQLFARGINLHLCTRLYFPDQPDNDGDAVLRSIPSLVRRNTLIAARLPDRDLPAYRFDIHLQGDRETVFFDV